MPPSSSTSSSRRRRGYAASAIFVLALAATLGVSAWRLEVHGISRTQVDRTVHGVTRMRGVEAEAIILADSVTAQPVFGPKPAPGVYPMVTNGYLRMAGQYLIFRRFLEHNRTKRMYLFAHPTLLANDISDTEGAGYARYTYIDSVFTRSDEKRILDAAGAHPKREVEPRFERLLKTWHPNHFPVAFSLDLFSVPPTNEPIRIDPAPRFPPGLSTQIRYFLARFEADCTERHIECIIVQSPTPPGVPRNDMTLLQPQFPGLRFLDTHDFTYYPSQSFPDGWHLDRATGYRYLRAIQTYIAPLFATAPTDWDGTKVSFDHVEILSMFEASTYHQPEGWGAWTSAATLSMRFRVSEELRGGEIRLGVRTPPQPDNAAVPLTVWLDGEKMTEYRSSDPQQHEVIFKMGPRMLAKGSMHTLELRLPRAVNLKALGMSSDPRDLGPGIVSIAWCGPGRCGWPQA